MAGLGRDGEQLLVGRRGEGEDDREGKKEGDIRWEEKRNRWMKKEKY